MKPAHLTAVTVSGPGAPVPETDKIIEPRALNRIAKRFYGAVTPETITYITREVEVGVVENFADLVNFILRTDLHIRAVYLTRIMAVAGAKWDIEPAIKGNPMSEAAAKFCHERLNAVPDIERLFADLMNATGMGWAVAEHEWTRRQGVWDSWPTWILPRECRFEPDWTLSVRDAHGQYIRTGDHPGKFIVHLPRPISDVPNQSGELLALLWDWLFKRWIRKFQLTAVERFASPFIYGITPNNADKTIREKLQRKLESFSSDQVAVFDDGTIINVLEASSKTPGEPHQNAIDAINAEITKGILGSTLNTEILSPCGNRAAAESQGEKTMTPRACSDAARLAGTIERDWLAYLCKYNAHLFGGIPPTPKAVFKVDDAELPEVNQLLVDSGAITLDELRRGSGLEPVGPDHGGNKPIPPKSGQIYQYHLQGQIVTRDDVRKQLGLEPIGGPLGAELLDINPNMPQPPGSADAAAPLFNRVITQSGLVVPVLNATMKLSTSRDAAPTSSDSPTTPLEAALSGRSVTR